MKIEYISHPETERWQKFERQKHADRYEKVYQLQFYASRNRLKIAAAEFLWLTELKDELGKFPKQAVDVGVGGVMAVAYLNRHEMMRLNGINRCLHED